MGEDEFVRVTVGRVGDRFVATPMARGAGVIMSLVKADGIVRVPRFSEGFPAGTEVSVELLRTRTAAENNIVAIGRPDLELGEVRGSLGRLQPTPNA